MNDYLYAVTSTNDNSPSPEWVGRYSDALSAVGALWRVMILEMQKNTAQSTCQSLVARCTLRYFIVMEM